MKDEVRSDMMTAGIRAADRSAAVAAVFCLLVFLLLLGNMWRGRAVDPIKPPVLEKKLLALNREPKNEGLKLEVRRLDREIRSAWFNGRAFAMKGFYVLIGGICVFLISIEASQALRRRMPVPRPSAIREPWAALATSRRTVAALGTLGAGILVLIAVVSRHDAAAEYSRAAEREFRQLMTGPNPAAEKAVGTTGDTGSTGKSSIPAPPTEPTGPSATANQTSQAALPVPSASVRPMPIAPAAGISAKPVSISPVSPVFPVVHESYPSARRTLSGPAFPTGWESAWPVFRGPSVGTAPAVTIPATIDAAKGQGIVWKVDIPMPGWNSPVVWGDRVFLTGADKTAREIYCLNVTSGAVMWKTPFPWPKDGPGVKVMDGTGYAPSTGATDGKRFYAAFVNGEVVCVDNGGKVVWTRGLGVPENGYGHATSLALYGNGLIVQLDHGEAKAGKSRLLALDAESGKTVWEAARPVGSSWSTPVLVKAGEKELLVTCAEPWVIAYDPATGQELWRAEALKGEIVCSAAVGADSIFVCTQGSALSAIKTDGSGDVTKNAVAWKYEEDLPDIASPVAGGELVYLATSEGLVACIDVKTGKKVWDHQYDASFHASPVVAGKQLILLDTKGALFVLETGRLYKEVSQGQLGDNVEATPAFAGRRMFVRGAKRIYCVGGAGR